MIELLRTLCEKYEIEISDNQLKKFDVYYNFLVEYNKNVNLTSITEKHDVAVRHFLDSIIVTKFVKLRGKIIDVGSGAGFPGVPLKILNDNLDITLLDGSGKKTKFLDLLCKKLEINTKIINSRTEEISKKYLNSYDFSIARAVAPMCKLYKFCMPFVKKNGYFIAMKGPSYLDELNDPKFKFSNLYQAKKFSYESNERAVIIMKK